MSMDPAGTNPDALEVVFENERVPVLGYDDQPGHRTTPHRDPGSVMYTLSSVKLDDDWRMTPAHTANVRSIDRAGAYRGTHTLLAGSGR